MCRALVLRQHACPPCRCRFTFFADGMLCAPAQVWQWQNEDGSTKEYYDAESFRAAVEEEQLDSDLRALLPRPDGKPIEKPAEAALRQRM